MDRIYYLTRRACAVHTAGELSWRGEGDVVGGATRYLTDQKIESNSICVNLLLNSPIGVQTIVCT